MELYLHIGTEKTGTTSIQAFMQANRDLLKRHRILYPRAPGESNHTGLAAIGQDRPRGELWKKHDITNLEQRDRYRARLEDALAHEVEQRRFHKAIMSNEHCSSRLLTDPEVETLRGFLCRFFDLIRIVVYLRRQDDFLLSTYSTDVKNGQTRIMKVPREQRIEARYDYEQLLDRWSRAFGAQNLICRKFEKSSLMGGDLITDFLAATGCDLGLEWERPGTLNSSLDARCLEFLRLVNLRFGREQRPQGLVPRLERISDGPLLDLTDADRAALMEMVRASNRHVAKKYFGGVLSDSDDPLFARRADTRPRTCDPALSAEDAVNVAVRLLTLDKVKGRQRDRPVAFETPSAAMEAPAQSG